MKKIYKRKCDWCIFCDGHRERIRFYYHPYYSREEIIFNTKSGTYKYHAFTGERLEYISKRHARPSPYNYMLGTHFSRIRTYDYYELSFTGRVVYDLRTDYIPCYNIQRIELVRR